MNVLLLFFALPIATIILAIAVNKLLRSPILTALVFFAIYLIVAFAFLDESFLIFAIVYTLIAFATAYISEFFFRNKRCRFLNENNSATLSANDANNNTCNCNRQETVTANLTNNNTGNRSTWCCYRRN